MMPRGYPDDNLQSHPLGQTIADNAELAARLGAKTAIQRSGNVIYSTAFENGASDWLLVPIGLASADVAANNGIISPCSLRLYPGNKTGNSLSVFKRMPSIDIPTAGWEFYIDFRPTVPPSVPTVTFIIDIVYNTVRYFYSFDILPSSHQVVIHNWDVAHVDTPFTITLPFELFGAASYSIWHYVKVVVSPQNGCYKTLIFDDLAYNLTDLLPDITNYLQAGYIRLTVYYTDDLSNAVVYLGSTVLTINEA